MQCLGEQISKSLIIVFFKELALSVKTADSDRLFQTMVFRGKCFPELIDFFVYFFFKDR